MVDPLPHLGSADLGGCRVLHEVVYCRRSYTIQPRRHVPQAHVDVGPEALDGDVAAGEVHGEEIVGGRNHVGSLAFDLVGGPAKDGVELGPGHLDQVRVCDPGAVAAVVCFTALVLGDHSERGSRYYRVSTVRDERAHPTDGMSSPAVAGGNHQLGVRPHERHGHGDV